MTDSVRSAALAAYADFWQGLTIETIDRLDGLAAADMRFKNPFNDVTGLAAFKQVLAGSLKHIVEPKFTITGSALVDDTAYIRWRFDFTTYLKRQAWVIEGMSEIRFGADGRVVSHVDHWDSGTQFYMKLPFVGFVLKMIRRKLQH